jgi:dTDP-4-amino-4,6-dideoxygalactose transaminase
MKKTRRPLNSVLAIHGGRPVLKRPLPAVHNISGREIAAVVKVLRRGPLSGFVGVPGPNFLGGPQIHAFESAFRARFQVKHAVSFNSATTALHGAIVALKIGPGDEVIVPAWTMSASPMSIIMNGAVPIFADIDERTFCIDPKSVRVRITKNTKAIMAVNLFGQMADYDELLKISQEHKLAIIEDNAQSPGATWRGRHAGTVGDIGVYSFNIHKTIQAGEGGVLVTNNGKYALRGQLCRNHGESVVEGLDGYDAGPIFGSNYRMTELTAAIADVQLARLDQFTRRRTDLADYLTKKLHSISGINTPYVGRDNTHVYYIYPMRIRAEELGLSRDALVSAMAAEGFPMSRGYVKPLHLLPIFQTQKAFNDTSFPFKSNYYDGKPDYSLGSCPVAERLHDKEFTATTICQFPYTKRDIDHFVIALKKVLANKHELK